ncbi:hypothetical protein EBZ39_01005 [bacterium]|nr:hypothetical protein [bacterium]
MKANSFDIIIRGATYFVDVLEDNNNTDVYIEKDDDSDEDIPVSEMKMVVDYLINEGFIKKPKFL